MAEIEKIQKIQKLKLLENGGNLQISEKFQKMANCLKFNEN
jgi:hypothetical protein